MKIETALRAIWCLLCDGCASAHLSWRDADLDIIVFALLHGGNVNHERRSCELSVAFQAHEQV